MRNLNDWRHFLWESMRIYEILSEFSVVENNIYEKFVTIYEIPIDIGFIKN